jgi:hypothetical protein
MRRDTDNQVIVGHIPRAFVSVDPEKIQSGREFIKQRIQVPQAVGM